VISVCVSVVAIVVFFVFSPLEVIVPVLIDDMIDEDVEILLVVVLVPIDDVTDEDIEILLVVVRVFPNTVNIPL
jgi:hypothetical protein